MEKKEEKDNWTPYRGVHIDFRGEPYDIQKEYMHKVIDACVERRSALLASPTGTGKSRSLENAVLSWRKTMTSKSNIIITSRTHTQLKKLKNELVDTNFDPTTAIMGSRNKYCPIYNSLSDEEKNRIRDVDDFCMKLTGGNILEEEKERLEEEVEVAPGLRIRRCNYERKEFKNVYQKAMKKENDIEDICKEHNVCPYYYSNKAIEEAEVKFIPYNYLIHHELEFI